MRRFARLFLILLALNSAQSAHCENWPVWRGPRGDGTSLETNLPTHWSATSNVVWKTELPGKGHASPIVWQDKIFTVTCLPETEERKLLCLDRKSGKILWQQTVLKSPLERKHSLNSHASSTPATDGKLVYVAFLDVNQMAVAAYDFSGKQKWIVRPGAFSSVHGFCSSPILFKDKVIVNGDHDGDSYLVALDRLTGKTIWKTPRLNRTRSYCVPLLREMAGVMQMVLTGDKCVASYDPNTGKLLWIIDGPTEQFVASPVYSEKTKLIYITGGYPDHHILAIRPDGTGNVTKTHIVWRTNKGAAYVPSPIIEGDYFLIVSDSGVAHCFEAAPGKLLWQERMGEHHASLISANGLVYFLNDEGVMRIVKPGPEYQLVAQNELGEKCFPSPAISEGNIFIRGEKHLFCIGAATRQANNLRLVATQILDETKPAPERDAIITANADKSAKLIVELVNQIQVGAPDEYRGIPSIWKVAIAAGKRNLNSEINEVLSISLPKRDEPLRDWQAVVIGGGIINGLSLEGVWPRERIEKLLRDDEELEARWNRSIQLASIMSDDERVRHGTRYDALRMLGVAPWETYGAQLTKYLAKEANGELQQGAVSGLSDMDADEAARTLIDNFENFSERNRQFALDAFLRTDARISQLLDALANGKIKFSALGSERLKKLRELPNEKLRQRVEQLEKTSTAN